LAVGTAPINRWQHIKETEHARRSNGRPAVFPAAARHPRRGDDQWVLHNSMIGKTHNIYMADVHSLA
jgi:hypothetical protein